MRGRVGRTRGRVIHGIALLIERHMIRRAACGRTARIEMRTLARMQRRARRGVREMGALPRRGDRHGAAHGTSSGQVTRSGSNICSTVHACAAELVRRHAGDAVRYSRIAIDVGHVDIAGDVHRAEAVPVKTGAIPGTEAFKRSERNPSDIAESEAKANAESGTSPSEETDQCRPPVIRTIDRTRPPCPAVGSVVPTAVMIRSPAPRIAAHPGPAVIIDPHPAAHLIRSPTGIDRRYPNLTVGRIVDPASVGVQFLGAIDVGVHVASAAGFLQILIATEIPFIPLILSQSRCNLKLGIVSGAASVHSFACGQLLGTFGRRNLGLTGANGDFC